MLSQTHTVDLGTADRQKGELFQLWPTSFPPSLGSTSSVAVLHFARPWEGGRTARPAIARKLPRVLRLPMRPSAPSATPIRPPPLSRQPGLRGAAGRAAGGIDAGARAVRAANPPLPRERGR